MEKISESPFFSNKNPSFNLKQYYNKQEKIPNGQSRPILSIFELRLGLCNRMLPIQYNNLTHVMLSTMDNFQNPNSLLDWSMVHDLKLLVVTDCLYHIRL